MTDFFPITPETLHLLAGSPAIAIAILIYQACRIARRASDRLDQLENRIAKATDHLRAIRHALDHGVWRVRPGDPEPTVRRSPSHE